MALRTEFVEFVVEKVLEELVDRDLIEIPDEDAVREKVFEVLNEEVTLEDRLNDEVRTLLNEYSNQIRESGASYQETFKLIKRKLVRERKIVL
jgi:hypothetical protein